MYKLFTDKTELFECDIKLTGASLKNSQARLLIESDDFTGRTLRCILPTLQSAAYLYRGL